MLKAESSEELARKTRMHRLDMIAKWGRIEVEKGTIQAEQLLETIRDPMD
jgi:hypothetical protein